MNKLEGKIVEIQSSQNISMVKIDIDGDVFSSIILEGMSGPSNYKLNDSTAILFKEAEVGIAKGLTGRISLRNRFKAIIKKIEKAPILAKITLRYRKYDIESIITTLSAEQLELKENEEVEWLVKANEVTLMKKTA